MSKKKPSVFKLRQYAVLHVLNEADKSLDGLPIYEKDAPHLVKFADYKYPEEKDIVSALGKLVSYGDVRILRRSPRNLYQITESGKGKFKFFKNKKGWSRYWVPPWDR